MHSISERLPADAARQVSLAVVEELAPDERGVALGFLEPLIEMAEEGELPYIDPRAPGGGFGSSDPLFVTIIPVVVEVLRELKKGAVLEQVWARLSTDIERIARKIGSENAQDQVPALEAAVRRAFERLLPP